MDLFAVEFDDDLLVGDVGDVGALRHAHDGALGTLKGQPRGLGNGGGDFKVLLEDLELGAALAHGDHVAGVEQHAGHVDLAAVQQEMSVTDQLAGLGTGRAVAEAIDNVVKAALKQDEHVAARDAFHLLGGDVDSTELLLAHTVGKTDLLLLLKLKAVNRLLVAAAGRSSGRNIALAEQLVVLGIAEDVHAEAANDLALRGDFSVDVLGH